MNAELMSEERLRQGYVIILPGIEGRSLLNRGIRRGLLWADVPYALEIYDWTYGPLCYFVNLRHRRRHRDQAARLAEKITAYRATHPTQPVYLIGHSAGGAMTIFALEQLAENVRISGGILLVPAISPGYDVSRALKSTDRGLWNFSSWGDAFFVGLGTVVCGTCDGKHVPAAGMVGFQRPRDANSVGAVPPALHEVRYRPSMLADANLGGHFGPVNPRFVSRWIAPIILGGTVADFGEAKLKASLAPGRRAASDLASCKSC